MAIEDRLFSLIFNRWSLVIILFLAIWLFGAGEIIARNPILIIFAILAFIILRDKEGKK